MASLGVRCGGNYGVLDNRFVNVHYRCDQKAGPRSLAASSGSDSRCRRAGTSMSSTTSLKPMKKSVKRGGYRNEAISRDKLDEWMRESVVDIVKNLREAPLFLRFYTTDDGKSARFETEKAVAEECWPILEEQWENGTSTKPEGIIFVKELEDDHEEDNDSGASKAWGIVIQDRGSDRGAPVCYLLKTSSRADPGLWCTHFCLVRVKNFRETTKSQLQNCWLLQYQ